MSLEAIKSISQAEEKSAQDIIEAQQSAKKAVSDAEKAGAAAIEKGRARAEEEIRALMKAAEARADEKAEELRQSTANKCAAMRVHAEGRLDEAASLIVRRVVES